MWPVHTWLPDAHVEAPTGGSVVLAAIMLKLGAYGFLRFSLPITPDASHEWAWFIIALSLIAVVYIGLVALVQQDMKKLVAYSSIAHMGFVTLGFFIFNELGVSGGIVQMISHGFVSGAMFLCIGVLYDRVHSREIAAYGGVVNTMPKFAAFAVLFAMANCGLPGTAGFVGEWMVILGTVKVNFWIAAARRDDAGLGAAYTLWMVKRVYFGADRQRPRARARRPRPPRVRDARLLAVAVLCDGPVPEAVHRRHARVGDRAAAARRRCPKLAPEATPNHELARRLPRPPGDRAAGDGLRRRAGRPVGHRASAASSPTASTQASLGVGRARPALVLRRRRRRSTRCSAWSSPTRWATCSACSRRWR